jgi:CBS domain containing-hemolysin-like protein
MLEKLGSVPKGGEVVSVGDWRLTVVDVERNRISKVKVEKVGPGSFALAPLPSRE